MNWADCKWHDLVHAPPRNSENGGKLGIIECLRLRHPWWAMSLPLYVLANNGNGPCLSMSLPKMGMGLGLLVVGVFALGCGKGTPDAESM